MEKFIRKPSIEMLAGIRVTKDTEFEFTNDKVNQTVKDLVFHSITHVEGDGFDSTYDTTIYLNEGDVLVFEEAGRGYIKPVEEFVTVKEAIEELKCIEDL